MVENEFVRPARGPETDTAAANADSSEFGRSV
jgi:hypothetical protein